MEEEPSSEGSAWEGLVSGELLLKTCSVELAWEELLLRGGLIRRNRDPRNLERASGLPLGARRWSAAGANGGRNCDRGHRGGEIVYGNGLVLPASRKC